MNIKIFVATHKKYRMPSDDMYTPIQVGRQINKALGYVGDDTGDNVSEKNPNYCELTAQYWIWKNIKADYVGLVHYRRYFSEKSILISSLTKKWNKILSTNKTKKLLSKFDVILPTKRHYWIETNKSHYEHAHNGKDLEQTRNIIRELYPEYMINFDLVMKQTASHRFNMYIMKKKLFDKYSEWLFDILFHLESKIDISKYSPKEARVFGYISERLLDVWIEKNRVKYAEEPVMFMEKQNWLRKIYQFLYRKFL